jgi:hypothetical protein
MQPGNVLVIGRGRQFTVLDGFGREEREMLVRWRPFACLCGGVALGRGADPARGYVLVPDASGLP